ncbi:MAG: hypothetical protein Kow0074_04260 [Candidatus Zixiibacteriota bacterium]
MPDVLLTITAVFVLLGIMLVLWPLRVRLQVWPGRARFEIRYFLLGLTMDFLAGESKIRLAGVTVATSKVRERVPKEKKEKTPLSDLLKRLRHPGPERLRRRRVLWAHRPLLRRVTIDVVKLVGRILRAFRMDHGKLALVLGLGNPAKTGIAAGCIYAALPSLQMGLPRWQITFVPEFTRAQMALDADIALRLIPLKPLYEIMRTLGTLPWRRLWKLRAALGQ